MYRQTCAECGTPFETLQPARWHNQRCRSKAKRRAARTELVALRDRVAELESRLVAG
jgi:hypothetical protein